MHGRRGNGGGHHPARGFHDEPDHAAARLFPADRDHGAAFRAAGGHRFAGGADAALFDLVRHFVDHHVRAVVHGGATAGFGGAGVRGRALSADGTGLLRVLSKMHTERTNLFGRACLRALQ